MTGLVPGTQAPVFTLPDYEGRAYHLSEALSRGPVVLVFFRGGWCPFCNTYLRRVQTELAPGVLVKGGSLVALSSDRPGVQADEGDKSTLGFPVVSDPEGRVLALYNAAHVLDDAEYLAEREWHDLEAYSGNSLHVIAVPGVTVLDRTGVVLFNELNLDLTRRPEPRAILAALP